MRYWACTLSCQLILGLFAPQALLAQVATTVNGADANTNTNATLNINGGTINLGGGGSIGGGSVGGGGGGTSLAGGGTILSGSSVPPISSGSSIPPISQGGSIPSPNATAAPVPVAAPVVSNVAPATPVLPVTSVTPVLSAIYPINSATMPPAMPQQVSPLSSIAPLVNITAVTNSAMNSAMTSSVGFALPATSVPLSPLGSYLSPNTKTPPPTNGHSPAVSDSSSPAGRKPTAESAQQNYSQTSIAYIDNGEFSTSFLDSALPALEEKNTSDSIVYAEITQSSADPAGVYSPKLVSINWNTNQVVDPTGFDGVAKMDDVAGIIQPANYDGQPLVNGLPEEQMLPGTELLPSEGGNDFGRHYLSSTSTENSDSPLVLVGTLGKSAAVPIIPDELMRPGFWFSPQATVSAADSRSCNLHNGSILIYPESDFEVRTLHVTVKVQEGAACIVSVSGKITRVLNLASTSSDSVSICVNQHRLASRPGQEICIMHSESLKAAQILMASEPLARRGVSISNWSGKVYKSSNDFSILDALRRHHLLQQVRRDDSNKAAQLFQQICKTAAAISLTRDVSRGAYSSSAVSSLAEAE